MNNIEYQSLTPGFAVYPVVFETEYLALGLVSEAGEIAAIVKRAIRDETPPSISELADELGDVLWYVSQLCNAYGLTIGEVMEQNITKLNQRKAKGTIKGKGKR